MKKEKKNKTGWKDEPPKFAGNRLDIQFQTTAGPTSTSPYLLLLLSSSSGFYLIKCSSSVVAHGGKLSQLDKLPTSLWSLICGCVVNESKSLVLPSQPLFFYFFDWLKRQWPLDRLIQTLLLLPSNHSLLLPQDISVITQQHRKM